MPREVTGSKPVLGKDGIWRARVTICGERCKPPIALRVFAADDEAGATKRTRVLADLAKHITAGYRKAMVMDALQEVADAPTVTELNARIKHAEQCISGTFKPKKSDVPTTGTVLERWLANTYADDPDYTDQIKRVGPKTINRNRATYTRLFKDIVDNVPINRVADYHKEAKAAVATVLGKDTRRVYLTTYKKLCELAVILGYAEHALPPKWMPRRGKPRDRQWVYPMEDWQMMGCTTLPLWQRFVFGWNHRNGQRPGELCSMLIHMLDRTNGTMRVPRQNTKTNELHFWALGDGCHPAALAWIALARASAGSHEPLMVDDHGKRIVPDDLPALLRDALRTSGCKRAELYDRRKDSRNLVTHDQRATMCTVKLANGWTERQVMAVSGHETVTSLEKYVRRATVLKQLNPGDFAPLHMAIPELAAYCLDHPHMHKFLDSAIVQPVSCHPIAIQDDSGSAKPSQSLALSLSQPGSIVESVLRSEVVDMTKNSIIPHPPKPSSPVQPDTDGESMVELAALRAQVELLTRLVERQPAQLMLAMASQLASNVSAAVLSELRTAGVIERPRPALVAVTPAADDDDPKK